MTKRKLPSTDSYTVIRTEMTHLKEELTKIDRKIEAELKVHKKSCHRKFESIDTSIRGNGKGVN